MGRCTGGFWRSVSCCVSIFGVVLVGCVVLFFWFIVGGVLGSVFIGYLVCRVWWVESRVAGFRFYDSFLVRRVFGYDVGV